MNQIKIIILLAIFLLNSIAVSAQKKTPRLPKDRLPALLVIGNIPEYSIKDWKERIIKKEGFAISSPIVPAQNSRPMEISQVKLLRREFIVQTRTARYDVRITDGKDRRLEAYEIVKQRIEVASHALDQDPECTDVIRNFFDISGYPAVDVKYRLSREGLGVSLGWVRMTIVDGRIYQLNAETHPNQTSWPAEAQLFMDSFRLLKNAALQSPPKKQPGKP
jgi:hypothetical protein